MCFGNKFFEIVFFNIIYTYELLHNICLIILFSLENLNLKQTWGVRILHTKCNKKYFELNVYLFCKFWYLLWLPLILHLKIRKVLLSEKFSKTQYFQGHRHSNVTCWYSCFFYEKHLIFYFRNSLQKIWNKESAKWNIILTMILMIFVLL